MGKRDEKELQMPRFPGLSTKRLQVLENPQWPPECPFDAEDFEKFDPSPDTQFYDQAELLQESRRLLYHERHRLCAYACMQH